MANPERPFDILNRAVGETILVSLKGGHQIRGKLTSFDIHMNLVLVEAERLEEGEAKAKMGTILLRGGNIMYLSPVK